MSNKVFQSKVAQVPGGVEMLVAAGYVITDKTAESESSSTSGAPVEKDLFLVHEMDRNSERRLDYTISR